MRVVCEKRVQAEGRRGKTFPCYTSHWTLEVAVETPAVNVKIMWPGKGQPENNYHTFDKSPRRMIRVFRMFMSIIYGWHWSWHVMQNLVWKGSDNLIHSWLDVSYYEPRHSCQIFFWKCNGYRLAQLADVCTSPALTPAHSRNKYWNDKKHDQLWNSIVFTLCHTSPHSRRCFFGIYCHWSPVFLHQEEMTAVHPKGIVHMISSAHHPRHHLMGYVRI